MPMYEDPCQKCAHDNGIRNVGYSWKCRIICDGECPTCGADLDDNLYCGSCDTNWMDEMESE